ncbi:MAG: hypothetical protein KDA37_07205 [Planctomycetales bacterium]|nr:hypothetical protein [Planctomycetales bacterium]
MTSRLLLLAALMLSLPGCARWNTEKWDLSRFRDPRATDIDHRLTQRPEPVSNPFSSGQRAEE